MRILWGYSLCLKYWQFLINLQGEKSRVYLYQQLRKAYLSVLFRQPNGSMKSFQIWFLYLFDPEEGF